MKAPVPAVIVEPGPDGPMLRVIAVGKLDPTEARELARALTTMADKIDHPEADAPCLHASFYWINRARLNWRCTDKCGFQFFGTTVTDARRQAKRNDTELDG